MNEVLVIQDEIVLVIEEDSQSGVLTVEVETVLLVEDTEVVILEVSEPGPPGVDGTNDIVSDPVAYYILAKN